MNRKIAIIALTRKGTELAQRLGSSLPKSHLYIPVKFASSQKKGVYYYHNPVKETVRKSFHGYDGLVLIMATGIAVRSIASELDNKHKDPAVVVVDEGGKFAISLISGHIGGANELVRDITELVGAQPVITTASEVSGTIAIDLLGKKFGWELEDKTNLTAVSAAVVNGEEVGIYQSCGEQDWLTEEGRPDNIHIFTDLESMQKAACTGTIIITDRLLDEELPKQAILYRPKSLVIGIGCNRGVSCSRIEEAAQMVLINNGLSIKSIRNIATIELKRDEAGLLEFAQKYVFPIEFFTEEALSQVEFPSSPSNLIYNNVGTYAVCEPAALLSSKNASLIVPKTKVSGDVTIAVARISRARKELQ